MTSVKLTAFLERFDFVLKFYIHGTELYCLTRC